jgi:hypothetical protein
MPKRPGLIHRFLIRELKKQGLNLDPNVPPLTPAEQEATRKRFEELREAASRDPDPLGSYARKVARRIPIVILLATVGAGIAGILLGWWVALVRWVWSLVGIYF